jgi:hypothetical protein
VKVISFCLWGNDPKYTEGAIANAKLAAEIYPDWVCRFYIGSSTDFSVTESLIATTQNWIRCAEVEGEGRFIDMCGGSFEPRSLEIYHMNKPGDWRMMFDRFLPGSESKVEAFISRDCDSRLTLREKAAVDEWLASDFGFHSMRDHPQHSVPILGGMWGMKCGEVPRVIFEDLIERWPKEDRWQTDQEWLAQWIWPQYMARFMNHDDGFWNHMFGGSPFPTAREADGEFVGATYDENGIIDAGQVAELKQTIR